MKQKCTQCNHLLVQYFVFSFYSSNFTATYHSLFLLMRRKWRPFLIYLKGLNLQFPRKKREENAASTSKKKVGGLKKERTKRGNKGQKKRESVCMLMCLLKRQLRKGDRYNAAFLTSQTKQKSRIFVLVF